jgi:hypothetical protein
MNNKRACPMNKSQVSASLPSPPPSSQTQSIGSSTPTLTKSKHKATKKVLSHNFFFYFWLGFVFFVLFLSESYCVLLLE